MERYKKMMIKEIKNEIIRLRNKSKDTEERKSYDNVINALNELPQIKHDINNLIE